jgi:DNA-directed RNA polymerase subunit beta
MSDKDFNDYIQNSIQNTLRLIVPPFQGDTVDQVVETSKKLGIPLAEYLYLPELGPNVKTKYPVAIGYLYFQRLEQIAGLKSHARNVGRYIKTTLSPTRGKARAGGQKMGEMDTWCMLAYGTDGKDVLNQMFAVSADNLDVKNQVLNDIVRNGKADISEEVELSGSGEYFNAVCTAMGIDVRA